MKSSGFVVKAVVREIKTKSSDWSVREFVDRGTKRTARIYTYKGKPCKRIVLYSKLAVQLSGYVLIEKDLRSALLWLREIHRLRGDDYKLDKKNPARKSGDRERYNIIKGLFVACLTFYGKSFAQANGRKIKLDKKQISKEFHSIHDQVLKLRNNFAAHSGEDNIEQAQVAVVLPLKVRHPPNLFKEMNQPDFMLDGDEENSLIELIEHVHEITKTKIDVLQTKIYSEEVIPKGYDYWKEA